MATRPYDGISADRRREDREHRLVDAALELMCEKGVGSLTTRDVARAAGLSPRYLYETFDDLDDLRVSTFDAVSTEVAGRLLAAIVAARPDVRSQARAAVAELLAYAEEHPNRARFALVASFGDPELRQRRHAMARALSRGFAEYLRPHVPDSVSDDALAVGARLVFGAMAEVIVARLDGDAIAIDATAGDELVDFVVDVLERLG